MGKIIIEERARGVDLIKRYCCPKLDCSFNSTYFTFVVYFAPDIVLDMKQSKRYAFRNNFYFL